MPTMYLLNTDTLRLECFPGETTKPKYAILSHRWGNDEDEASFQDVGNGIHLHKQGWKKIASACGIARVQGHKYLWADTCCINKVPLNNKEQTDAINSMYTWYGASEVCYAYLEDVVDVNDEELLKKSQWFERGWTLQEMLAPEELIFFSQNWTISVDRFDIPGIMSTVAGVVGGHASFWFLDDGTYTISEVMSWASRRKTTKPEDAAYSLIGLFKLQHSMDISYGEGGARAFVRLQEQLMQGGSHTDDMTIFDWTSDSQESVPRRSMFATSPKAFEEHDRSIFIRVHSDIIEKCKTLMGTNRAKEGSEEEEGSEEKGSEEEGSEEGGSPGSESEGAMSNILVTEDGVHMSVWLLELKTACEMVGAASYKVDLGSAITTDEFGERKTSSVKMIVSEKNGTYYEAFDVVPSFRNPGRLRFFIMLVEHLVSGDDQIRGILLVSRENEVEKHRVIMNRIIGVARGSMDCRFLDPVLTHIIVA